MAADAAAVPWDLKRLQLGSRGLGDLQKMCDERGISRAAGQKQTTLVGLLEEWRTQNSSSGKRKAEAPEAQPAKKAKTSKAPAAAPTAAATGVRAKKLEEFLKEHGAEKLDRKTQLVSYMGNCTEALAYFKGKNKVTRYMLRNYFKTQTGQEVWAGLGIGPLGDVEFDHIYPLSHNGGYEHLYNYFAMPKELNGSEEFKYYCLLKSEYIGPNIRKDAENFMHWIARKAEHMIDISEWEQSRLHYSKVRG